MAHRDSPFAVAEDPYARSRIVEDLGLGAEEFDDDE
jgi:hypothetical protein